MEVNFYYDNLTCCSVELYWKYNGREEEPNNSYEYTLEQKEGDNNIITNFFKFKKIYQGDNAYYEVINLKPKQTYSFRLTIIKSGKSIKEKIITITTLKSPKVILSENSVKIANEEKIDFSNDLSQFQKDIINNCSKLNFEENNENIIKGDFNGIEIKITNEAETNITYISFDIKSDFYQFFDKYIKEFENNIIIPCHFIISKLPTILIFNLLEKGPVILTGKRMGGVIASSLVFYIMYIGKLMDNNFGNALQKTERNCIGVITFGSPSFLNNLTAAVKMKELTQYFYNIKHEFDYIPEIIDFINENQDYNNLLSILEKKELNDENINILNDYLENNKFTKDNLENNINKFKKIPFGYYYMMKESDYSLTPINEDSFVEFYYYKKLNSNHSPSNLKVYEKLSSEIQFNKTNLEFLEKKDLQLESVRIIRRIIFKNIKGIIKFKLTKFGNNIIPPDIIKKIILVSNNNEYIIEKNDIYYNNDIDITAYIDNLCENIIYVIIINDFGGEMSTKNIINVQGSGPNRKMLKDNIEKLFLFPFFKLFEIFYASLKDKEKYANLKEENFGNNFQDIKIKILKPFEKQIQILNELVFFSRPDILGKFEKEFIEEYTGGELDKEQMNYLKNMLKAYYLQALKIQQDQNINCLDSELNSIAKQNSFPLAINDNNEGKKKKLFMCNFSSNHFNNLIFQKFDDSYIKPFFFEKLIIITLEKIEDDIKQNLIVLNDDQFKQYLNNNIGKFYKSKIIPNLYFIQILILTSIEGGDFIEFNHKINWKKFFNDYSNYSIFPQSFIIYYNISFWGLHTTPLLLNVYQNLAFLFRPLKYLWTSYQKDFEKFYSKKEIEELNMKNLFYKIKTKDIINSNISQKSFNLMDFFFRNNKMYDFSEYSEKEKYGEKYYEKFLEILNNYSNDFPEDIQISIFDNLKDENKNKENNYITIKEIMNSLINDEESKKGFLALLRQSYLLGKLRCDIVRSNIFYFYIIGRRIFYWHIWKKRCRKINFYNKNI